jgi:hypothetical protein
MPRLFRRVLGHILTTIVASTIATKLSLRQLSDLHHEVKCSRSDNETLNAPAYACRSTVSFSRLSVCLPCHCTFPILSGWPAHAYRISPWLPRTFYKSPYTGCVIRRVTLPVRAHLKPGCQCSISNKAMLCCSPDRCGRLRITRPKAYRYSSVTVVTGQAVPRRKTYVEAPRSNNVNTREEGWHGLILISSTKIERQVVAGAAWSRVLSRLPTGPQINTPRPSKTVGSPSSDQDR